MAIQHFRDRDTEALYSGERVRRFEGFARQAERKLTALHAATSLRDLASVPGNHLEALGGDRKGQHSIRINKQWRICFVWKEDGPREVEIADYH